jgi:hypothetical protein
VTTLVCEVVLTIIVIDADHQQRSLLPSTQWYVFIIPVNRYVSRFSPSKSAHASSVLRPVDQPPSFTVFPIVWLQFVEHESARRFQHEDLYLFFFWLLIGAAHWVGFGLGIPYLLSAVPLTGAIICFGVANVLCHNPCRTRLTGGSGVEHMVLTIRSRGHWLGYKSHLGDVELQRI